MKIVAATMVYNEGDRLTRWIDYYGRQLGCESLLVIDHGSNDGSANLPDIASIRLPRSEFDDIQRAEFVSDLCRALLLYYDAMIYTGCDEFLVADPAYHKDLRRYVETVDAISVRSIGFELIHRPTLEAPIDFSRPILQQRRYCWFRSVECKPAIAKEPVRWTPGFHHCSKIPTVDPHLYMFHLKHVDYEIALKRLELTRNLNWSERSINGRMGAHQRVSNEEATRTQFRYPEAFLQQNGAKQFSDAAFSDETLNLRENLKLLHGIYRCDAYAGSCYEIPERLRNVF